MKIAVVFGSHRMGGKTKIIKDMLQNLASEHEYDFISMSDVDIKPLTVNNDDTTCLDAGDDFYNVLDRLVNADINMIICPAYCPYPSKFTALMEKLLAVSYKNENKPLKGKRTAVFYYASTKILDEKPLKLLYQKYLMDDYSFFDISYDYINNEPTPNEKYNNDIVEYIKDMVIYL
jgi:multimeric flavodoxin WrbA